MRVLSPSPGGTARPPGSGTFLSVQVPHFQAEGSGSKGQRAHEGFLTFALAGTCVHAWTHRCLPSGSAQLRPLTQNIQDGPPTHSLKAFADCSPPRVLGLTVAAGGFEEVEDPREPRNGDGQTPPPTHSTRLGG